VQQDKVTLPNAFVAHTRRESTDLGIEFAVSEVLRLAIERRPDEKIVIRTIFRPRLEQPRYILSNKGMKQLIARERSRYEFCNQSIIVPVI
jgi:hypothetical protein